VGHPNLSDDINRLMDLPSIAFGSMALGGIIHVTATDARNGEPGAFRLQVAALADDDRGMTKKVPVLRLLDDGFGFWGADRTNPLTLPAGTLLYAGHSARHVPIYVPTMIGIAGIIAGRDYSFWYVGGKLGDAYVGGIQRLDYASPAEPQTEPDAEAAAYVTKLAQLKKDEERRREIRRERLNRAFTVQTKNTLYRFSALDENGRRQMWRGNEEPVPAALLSVYVGESLVAEFYNGEEWRELRTSKVQSISPDPDAPLD